MCTVMIMIYNEFWGLIWVLRGELIVAVRLSSGDSSHRFSLRVTNISLTTVFVNTMRIVPQNSVPNEFQIVVPQPVNFHIDSGDGRTIIIRFKPAALGQRTALLDIVTDDGDKQIELVGEGS